MQTEQPAYKRIVLKLSGEAVQERGGRDNISPTVVREIAERIKEVRDLECRYQSSLEAETSGAVSRRRIAAWIELPQTTWVCLLP
ncbi:MAG: hypothetical protein Udaeo2_16770 [Candidatus Udaeobacter sp.]|nr:MAG: hypothetical protein Udaeo2_16770 [Candidatus Udaeobacter sp.]